MAKGDRNNGWVSFFRAFTVLCAMILLLAQQGQELVGNGSGYWQVLSVYEGLTTWSVPALFMLWGMSALGEGKPNFRSALLGLVLPGFCMLVFWGALYAVVAHLLGGGGVTLGGIWNALVSAAGGNTHFHLWLLYPLMGIYLIHPVLHRFVSGAGKGEVLYFLALCFLFASVLPVWADFRPDSFWVSQLQRLRVHLVLGWTGCYVAGWYLRHHVINRAVEYLLYILGMAGMALTLIGSTVFGGGRDIWHLYTAPNVVLTAAAVCVLFRYVLGISEERSRRSAVNRMGSYSFGVYLFHQIWVLIFGWLDISVLAFSPVVSVPFFAVLFFVLSLPFVWLIQLIPGAGRYLM